MNWTNIVSYISFKEIAEILDIDTNTEFVTGGILTPEGTNYVFEEIANYCANYKQAHKKEIADDLQLEKENSLINKLISAYVSPEEVARKINWINKFHFVNQYTIVGSRLDFLGSSVKGEALIWFEVPDGFMLTIFPPIMTFINDMHYNEDSTLPEFNFDDVTAQDVLIALEQAIRLEICQIEKEVEEFIY